MRVGLIGLGAIGRAVVQLLASEAAREVVVVGALVRDPARPRREVGFPVVGTADALLALDPEIVVEAGGHAALSAHGPAILRAGRDLVAVSVGAFALPETHDALLAATCGGGRIVVASGAIGALDAISSATLGGLERVTHTTRKPPRSLLDVEEAAGLTEAREIFRGSAREGALRFPESINVAAAVSLAGIGLDRTEVCVIADPAVTRNHHEVVAEGAFGKLCFTIENVPTEDNPRTGRLVAASVVRTLLRRRAALVVG
jgi:aspartate dehydrogenase